MRVSGVVCAMVMALSGSAIAATPARPLRVSPLVSAAPKSEWTEIGMTGADSIWLIRRTDIANKAERFPQVWIRIDRSEEKRRTLSETHVLYAVSCDGHGIQYLKWIDYALDGSIATQDSAPFDPAKYQPVRPATMSQAVEDAACGRRAWWYDPKIPLAEVEPFD